MKNSIIRKSFLLFVVLVMIVSVFTLPASATFTYGDANSDSQVDIRDLIRLKNNIVNPSNTINDAAVDFDGDDELNGMDLVVLRQILLGIEEEQIEVSATSDSVTKF